MCSIGCQVMMVNRQLSILELSNRIGQLCILYASACSRKEGREKRSETLEPVLGLNEYHLQPGVNIVWGCAGQL